MIFSRLVFAHDVHETSSYQLQEVAAGNFVHVGSFPPYSSANRGDIANIGFIVGEKCVAVIDTGSSLHVGSILKSAIRRVTALPICAVIVTHVHPDHLLGLNAFTKDQPITVYGHHRLPKQIRTRSRFYLESLEQYLGTAYTKDHAVDASLITPVNGVLTLDLGNRLIEIKSWGHAHTDHDVSVTDLKTRTFWAGDLVFSEHIPILDSNIRQYSEVLGELQNLDINHYVVGHGPLDRPWHVVLTEQRRYLGVLLKEVRAAIKNDVSLMDAVNTVGWIESEHWHNFDLYHRRNVTTSYTDLEWEE
ncbi:quinoprotein relay system zinc metallohydrolase 2 [Burkholderiales bacterium]|nr:quinoprotein relay system zinc metallohydrolase 2 [Burkholderiales bacterium]